MQVCRALVVNKHLELGLDTDSQCKHCNVGCRWAYTHSLISYILHHLNFLDHFLGQPLRNTALNMSYHGTVANQV